VDIKTTGIVLRRINYGEADRILTFITPEGKISAIGKGVRREKSKLAGGIELFSISKITLKKSHKSNLLVLASARLDAFYNNILSDYTVLEFAYEALKDINKKSEYIDNPEFFSLTKQILSGLNSVGAAPLVTAWWRLNLLRASGDSVNLHTDTSGRKLSPSSSYAWDATDQAFREYKSGDCGANHIKLLRLIVSSPLATTLKVQDTDSLIPAITNITRTLPS